MHVGFCILLLSKRIDLPGQGYGPVEASPTGKNIVDVQCRVDASETVYRY